MKKLLWTALSATVFLSSNVAAENSLNAPKLPHGQLVRTVFNDVNICVYRRTPEDIKHLKEKYAESDASLRSQNEEFFIFDCVTPKGCFISFKPKGKAAIEYRNVHENGGLLDECFGLEYDFTGRLFNSKSDSDMNLKIPTHHFDKDGKVIFP
ncbi:hypothetical protein [Thalassotalea sp. Y01]|uniref:hypothetical protein n=1 Tax=Thalassotalea sp. Y01 TaxID=2729613 RepID=UPI00145D056D|nr:hypothetical protein [Thalassotalea sp. Y01]NMP16612.1 hypothetical protein [Thalassotalea sp. Y01]